MESLRNLIEKENQRLNTEKFVYVPKRDVPKGARCGNTAAALHKMTGELFNIKQFTIEVLKKEYQPERRSKKTAANQVNEILGENFTLKDIKKNKDTLMTLLRSEENVLQILEDLKNEAIKNEEKENELIAFFDSL